MPDIADSFCRAVCHTAERLIVFNIEKATPAHETVFYAWKWHVWQYCTVLLYLSSRNHSIETTQIIKSYQIQLEISNIAIQQARSEGWCGQSWKSYVKLNVTEMHPYMCTPFDKGKLNHWGKVAIRRKREFLFPSHLEEHGFLEVSIYIERNGLLFPVPNWMAPTLKRRKAAIQHVRLCSSSQQKSFRPLIPLRALCGFKREKKLIKMHTTWQFWQEIPLPHLKKIYMCLV